jgi:glycosyltransferase involved in cell wall biosynthesis
VGFASGGLVEAVASGRTGLLVAPEDVEALTDALATLVDDGQLRQRMGAEGRERMQKDFSIVTMAKEHVDVYESVIDA